jgi:hypothetical protein
MISVVEYYDDCIDDGIVDLHLLLLLEITFDDAVLLFGTTLRCIIIDCGLLLMPGDYCCYWKLLLVMLLLEFVLLRYCYFVIDMILLVLMTILY